MDHMDLSLDFTSQYAYEERDILSRAVSGDET